MQPCPSQKAWHIVNHGRWPSTMAALCPLDTSWSHLGRGNLHLENAFTRPTCGQACGTLYWLVLNVGRPSSRRVVSSLRFKKAGWARHRGKPEFPSAPVLLEDLSWHPSLTGFANVRQSEPFPHCCSWSPCSIAAIETLIMCTGMTMAPSGNKYIRGPAPPSIFFTKNTWRCNSPRRLYYSPDGFREEGSLSVLEVVCPLATPSGIRTQMVDSDPMTQVKVNGSQKKY